MYALVACYFLAAAVRCPKVSALCHSVVRPMLRIRMLSGEPVASMPVEELSDVKALKQQLNHAHGLPTRFRQRLFLCGSPLDDSAPLNSPMELELVLLSYSATSQTQAEAEELATASASGSMTEVRLDKVSLLQK